MASALVRRALAAAAISLTLVHAAAAAEATTGTRAAAGAVADGQPRDELWQLGRRIYREGIGESGAALAAVGAAQMPVAGKEAACATCHRRSGHGSSEGRFVVRPITGPSLQQTQSLPVHSPRIKARLGSSQRPPYDDALLARALRQGVDTAGKPLDPVMPRYALSERETQALSRYLYSLSATPSPGVDDREIHFATVIQPGVAPERRRAMLDVMRAFVADKDANVRQDELRREAGNMRMYRSYRKWVLHVWELNGPADSWGAQLEAHYQRQPVFALIGGLGDGSWRPIHEFGERVELPCILPQVVLPELMQPNQYTVYFSRGVVLDAEVLARHLNDAGGAGPLLQVYRRGDEAGATAAAALRAALSAERARSLVDHVLDRAPDAGLWQSLRDSGAAAAVLWLEAHDLPAVAPPSGAPLPVIYGSAALWSGRIPPALTDAGVELRLVQPSEAGPRRDARLLRSKLWLHNKNIALTDEAVQINTQFALAVVSDALGHMMDSFSRDLLIERLEHTIGQTPAPSMFQSVSLGPGQRYAAKGAAVVQVVDARKGHLKPLSGWIVP